MGPRTVSRFAALLMVPAVAIALQSGCAGHSTRDESAGTQGDKQAARELYAGQSSVVHATEFPVTSATEGMLRGDEAWRHGNLDLAVYLYVQSIAYDASAAGPFLKIGSIHERLGNRALAQRAFELALERDPENPAACERLGLLYLNSQRTDAAVALFERAIRLDPERWQSHNGLGIAADRRGDFSSAIARYDRALVLAPGTAALVNNRGYSRMLSGDLAGAEADFRLAIGLGAHAGTWTNLGKVEAKLAHYAEALECLLRDTGLAQAYNMIGEEAMESGDLAAAQTYFTLAIGASPRYYEAAQKNLGLANERLAMPGLRTTRIARTDANVYGTVAKDAVIGTVRRGLPVSVLKTQNARSLVSFRVEGGAQVMGWVASASLGDAVPLR